MSKKQKADLDDGYVRIANTLFLALLRLPIFSYEARVLLFIIYQTYGYNHKERELSNRYIGNGLGIDAANVSRAIKKLTSMNIIKKSLSGKRRTQILGMNTRVDEWVTVVKFNNTSVVTSDNIKSDNTNVVTSDNTSVVTSDNKYNTDQYQTDQNHTECSGSKLPRHNLTVFERLWNEWNFSQAGIDHVSRKQRAEIEEAGYLRMTDARLRYEKYFAELETKNNVPLSARTWFNGSYTRYLPEVDSNGFWRDIKNRKCKGDVCYE